MGKVAVVFSESHRQALIKEALGTNNVYTYRSAYGESRRWLMDDYAYLSVNGCSSILRRIGIRHDIVYDGEDLNGYNLVFYPHEGGIKLNGKPYLVLWGGHYNLFEWVGQYLQGHRDFEKVRKDFGDDSDFYLDQEAKIVLESLDSKGHADIRELISNPWHPYSNVLVLRHDTDSSDDLTYPEYELYHGIPATYAILRDKNFKKWRTMLEGCANPNFELALHYDSIKNSTWSGNTFPSRQAITGIGLSDQIFKTKRFGLVSATAHKHGNAFYYPETIDAMDFAYDVNPDLLGMGSMFRWHQIKYHKLHSTVEHPHVSVPFWFPFHPVVSTAENWHTLRGWDMGMFIEPSPDIIDKIFKNAKQLPGGVYMLGYHPAHARSDTFVNGGCLQWYEYAVKRARDEGWLIANYRDVLKRLNEWEKE